MSPFLCFVRVTMNLSEKKASPANLGSFKVNYLSDCPTLCCQGRFGVLKIRGQIRGQKNGTETLFNMLPPQILSLLKELPFFFFLCKNT